ncbi:hypothetical protein L1987_18510 [Smallanthus sonchifolius]|uniref:Uncharacterized protein n=1 Tax=Smallanthus sonchifolius TaxID=185202 RepID=A0ACB9J204_9ASTR|nr:hypothetical protein L1987_18510 [Smallanthus sonchifolius]
MLFCIRCGARVWTRRRIETSITTFALGILVPKSYILPMGSDLYLQPFTSLVADAHKVGLEVFASYFANGNLFALLSKLGPKQNSRYTYHSASSITVTQAVIIRLGFLSPPRSRLKGWIHHWSSQVWNMCYRSPVLPVLSIQQNCMGPISHTATPLDMCYSTNLGPSRAILLVIIYVEVTSRHILFGIVNGQCVDNLKSKASDVNSSSLPGLNIVTNRDIIGIYLANLIRLHWKRASRTNRGLMLASPLRPVHDDKTDGSSIPLLRPQDLR